MPDVTFTNYAGDVEIKYVETCIVNKKTGATKDAIVYHKHQVLSECTLSFEQTKEILAILIAGEDPFRALNENGHRFKVHPREQCVRWMVTLIANYMKTHGNLALLTVRIRPLFWFFIVAFNLLGATDIIVDYYHGNQVGLPAIAGQLGATYAIPIIYVPILITHAVALYWLVRSQPKSIRAVAGDGTGSLVNHHNQRSLSGELL